MRYFPKIGISSLSGFTTSNLPEGSNLYYTDERVDDRVAALLVAGSGIALTYNDAGNSLTITNTLITGLVGGQTVTGGTASGNDLTLHSTTNATKGSIFMGSSGTGFEYDETNNHIGLGASNTINAAMMIQPGTGDTGLYIYSSSDLATSPLTVDGFFECGFAVMSTGDSAFAPTNLFVSGSAEFVGSTLFIRPVTTSTVYTSTVQGYGAGFSNNAVGMNLDETVSDEKLFFHTGSPSGDSDTAAISNYGISVITTFSTRRAIRMQDAATSGSDLDTGKFTGFKAPATLSATSIYEMPTGFPSTSKFLQSDSSGVLTFVSGSKVLFDHFANAGNGTTVETDLYSDTLVASQLGTNGDKIWATYGLNIVNSTSTKQIKVKFAGTTIFDSGALTTAATSSMSIDVEMIRVSSTVIRYSIIATTSGLSTGTFSSVGELTGLTLSGTTILKITGQAAGVGAASNDIVAKLGTIIFSAAA